MRPLRKHNSSTPIAVTRLPVTFTSDVRRVITRFFDPGGEARIQNIVQRIAQLSDIEVARLLELVFERFRTRHSNIAAVFEQHYRNVMSMVGESDDLEHDRRLLIGSYFTMEYSIESAALFNPSIVAHPSQPELPDGAVRFIMSLRATGEGHVSSIVFRTGVIHSDHEIELDSSRRFAHPIGVFPDKQYDKRLFHRKLNDIGVYERAVNLVLDRLGDSFNMAELEHAITAAREAAPDTLQSEETIQGIRWLARSNYQLELSREAEVSEMVIFPQTSNESRGIEDLRMVRFVDDDDSVTYYGTCTAFDGYRILPQLIETTDFLRIGVHTLNGARAQNKGMALFPRRIGGHYVMCSRIRRREPLHHAFRYRPFLGDRRVTTDTKKPLGVRTDRQLRLASGDARRVARLDTWRGADADVLHRRDALGPGRSAQGDRHP